MRTTRRIAAVTMALLLPLAACSKSDSGSDSSTSKGTPAQTSTITIKGFKFSPTPATAKVGAKIEVTNEDGSAHTLTSTDGPADFDTGRIGKGETKTITLTKAGTYKYHCSIHNSMTGEITAK